MLSRLEENIFDDLVQDHHELWEWYAFFRSAYPELDEEQIIKEGNNLLDIWINKNWLYTLASNNGEYTLSKDHFWAEVNRLGSSIVDPNKSHIILEITPQALKDFGKAPSFEQGTRYTNPNAIGEIVRVQSGFSDASDPIKRGAYSKISKGGKITYVPLKE